MDRDELIELFEDTFPFWNKLSETDKETFIRSSQRANFSPYFFTRGATFMYTPKNRWH